MRGGRRWEGGEPRGNRRNGGRFRLEVRRFSGKLDKFFPFIRRDLEASRQEFGELFGGAAFVGLKFADGDDRTPRTRGELLLGKVKGAAPMFEPISKGCGLVLGGHRKIVSLFV